MSAAIGSVESRIAEGKPPLPPAVARELEQLEETLGQVVGRVFFGTMLKTMRESRISGPYGHGGRGEEVFAGQLHDLLAERAGGSSQGGLVEALYSRLAGQQERMSLQWHGAP